MAYARSTDGSSTSTSVSSSSESTGKKKKLKKKKQPKTTALITSTESQPLSVVATENLSGQSSAPSSSSGSDSISLSSSFSIGTSSTGHLLETKRDTLTITEKESEDVLGITKLTRVTSDETYPSGSHKLTLSQSFSHQHVYFEDEKYAHPLPVGQYDLINFKGSTPGVTYGNWEWLHKPSSLTVDSSQNITVVAYPDRGYFSPPGICEPYQITIKGPKFDTSGKLLSSTSVMLSSIGNEEKTVKFTLGVASIAVQGSLDQESLEKDLKENVQVSIHKTDNNQWSFKAEIRDTAKLVANHSALADKYGMIVSLFSKSGIVGPGPHGDPKVKYSATIKKQG